MPSSDIRTISDPYCLGLVIEEDAIESVAAGREALWLDGSTTIPQTI